MANVNPRVSSRIQIEAAEPASALRHDPHTGRTLWKIFDRLLGDLETQRREAVTARNNVCAGRPDRPFPADIVSQ